MSSSLLRPAARLGAAATAATLLILTGGAAHAGDVTPGDEATATAGPGDDASVTEEPAPPVEEEPAPGDPGEEEPAPGDPVEEEPVGPAYPELLDPAFWQVLLQEGGVVDAACFAAELPAPGEYLVADQDYLLVLDFAGIQSVDMEVYAYGEAVVYDDGTQGEPVATGDVIEVGTDPANDALILCTGTIPADFDGELPIDGDLPGGDDAGHGDDTGSGGDDGGTVGGRQDDGGQVLGPIVQTDHPVRRDGSLLVAGLVLAGAAGMSALGVRRRVKA